MLKGCKMCEFDEKVVSTLWECIELNWGKNLSKENLFKITKCLIGMAISVVGASKEYSDSLACDEIISMLLSYKEYCESEQLKS